MKPKVKEMLLEALRSGKYKQTTNSELRELNGSGKWTYCVLGVLCDIHRKTMKIKGWTSEKLYLERAAYLPKRVVKWAGLEDEKGSFSRHYKGKFINLTHANDNGQSFKQLAKLIERYF